MAVLKPPRAERVSLAGPAGDLQALIETPLGEDAEPLPAPAFAVVCHPHPLYGGTLDNKVVYTLARALQSLGAPAIRFNFRGVGTSAGQYDEARGETRDALAVIAYGRQRWPQLPLWLAGFSFGGAVAVRAADEAQPERLIAAAPGITLVSVRDVPPPACPWLIVQGAEDEVVAPEVVADWARSLAPAATLRTLPGAGHFFHGQLNELRESVLTFMHEAH